MKIVDFRKAVAAALAAGGLFVSSSALAVNHTVGDPSFEEINLGTLDYYYFIGPPNSPFWRDHAKSTGINAVYSLNAATVFEPRIPDPHSGNQAIDGEGAYNYQVLTDTFVAGRTYTFSAYVQGWEGATSDIQDRFWMYLFAGVGPTGDDAPGDIGQAGTMDGSSILRATWHQNGTIDGILKTGAGDSFLPYSGFNRAADAAWTLVGLTYTATASDEGKQIGVGFWANELGAVDDIALTSLTMLGDYDGNGAVGTEDYDLWKITFGDATAPGDAADGNRNGIVDAADYAVWRNNFTGPLVALGVPEPGTSVSLITACGLAVLRRTRRADRGLKRN